MKKYSSFVLYPIVTYVEKEVDEEIEADVTKVEGETHGKASVERNVKEVPEDELKSFYKSISGDWDDLLAVDFWHIEGFRLSSF